MTERTGSAQYATSPNRARQPRMQLTDAESEIVDLYAVGRTGVLQQDTGEKPFVQEVRLLGPKGDIVRVRAER
jgi:hypothetical protein